MISIVNQIGVGHATTPYPSDISIGGFKRGKILDANLTLTRFGHREPEGVDVMLSHEVANRTVISDVGYLYPVSNITLMLDDEAADPSASTPRSPAARSIRPTTGRTTPSPPPPLAVWLNPPGSTA